MFVVGYFKGDRARGGSRYLRKGYGMRDLGMGRGVQAGVQSGWGVKRVGQGFL